MALMHHHCVVVFLVLVGMPICSGGLCWARRDSSGTCSKLIKSGISEKECCAKVQQNGLTGYSDVNVTSTGRLFYLMFVDPPACKLCLRLQSPSADMKDPCGKARCGPNRVCRIDRKSGQPVCKCYVDCRHTFKHSVCGTNAVTFSNECQLRYHNCQLRSNNTVIDYRGTCKDTCDDISCDAGKVCIVDQYQTPHCVHITCPSACTNQTTNETVCGTDGKTYDSLCYLRQSACQSKRTIGIAYKGKCRAITCANLKCSKRKLCLTDAFGQSRCVTCIGYCFGDVTANRLSICGTDGNNYSNWCQLRKAACRTRKYIDVDYHGTCRTLI